MKISALLFCFLTVLNLQSSHFAKTDKQMKISDFKKTTSFEQVAPIPKNDCQVSGFGVTYLCKRCDGPSHINQGLLFDKETLRLVRRAEINDTYYFGLPLEVNCANVSKQINQGFAVKIIPD